MKTLLVSVLLCTAAFAAHAHNCPNEMKAIDAKLSANPSLSETELEKVRTLRAEGEKLHKEGKHTESMKALQQAKAMLGI